MPHAILSLVFAAAVAQPFAPPNIKPAARPPHYQEIPLPTNAEQLLKSIQSDLPIPPDLAKEVRDAAEKLRTLSPTDIPAELGKRKDLQDMAIEYLRAHPELGKANGMKIDPEDVRKFLKDNERNLPKIDGPFEPAPQRPEAPTPQAGQPSRRTFDQRVGRCLAEWLQDEETGGRFVEMMRDSPGFRDALDDLMRTVRQVDGGWQPNIPDLPEGIEPPKLLPGIGELPKFGLPEFGEGPNWWPKLPPITMPAFTMPALFDLSAPSLPEISGDGLQIAIAVVLVVGLLFALRLWAGRSVVAAERSLLPVPASIADAAELRRAFEALALNRFGSDARPWNHRLVAHRFGDGPAALELARLYEQIRYAPGDQPLSSADRESARRSLAELAGGSR